ncbi:SmtA protein [Methylophaga aminisulfidivorans MP]|uniref:tRNA 5-carboxymethoxyuridine methyltransferase n=1 Tax=Methylophaga aminisulfidivorans MP TaxID=1026882 RepID=F5T1L5_9GAMM|nr:methyltransferase domain-containing protein [Methylophaga aminisulfidivorans]EGL53109.1 SmtA protein [Methylophaga aminisulfidivorans MP]
MTIKHDRNFDDLFDRFDSKIYDTVKGEWRLRLLKEDLAQFVSASPLDVWDAGCGQGQISLWLAEQGHHLTLCDLSEKMLNTAKVNFEQANITANFYQKSAQSLASELPQFDLVICHAVLEWLSEPISSLQTIMQKVKPNGYLSLLFYNRNAMVYSNVLKGGWRLPPILNDSYIGKGNKLTPPNPQFPHEIIDVIHDAGFTVETHTGVRIFNDYMSQQARDNSDQTVLFELEHKYCRMPTYRDMGRYIHLLLKR